MIVVKVCIPEKWLWLPRVPAGRRETLSKKKPEKRRIFGVVK